MLLLPISPFYPRQCINYRNSHKSHIAATTLVSGTPPFTRPKVSQPRMKVLSSSSLYGVQERSDSTTPYRSYIRHLNHETFMIYLLLVPLKIIAPTPAAAIATPLRMATPIKPSFATLSSISPLKLLACKFAGS